MSKAALVINAIIEALPTDSAEPVWTDGNEILAHNISDRGIIETALGLFGVSGEIITGYYDPGEDARDGDANDHTGCYYITID